MKQLQIAVATGSAENYTSLTFPNYTSHSVKRMEESDIYVLRVSGADNQLVGEVPASKIHFILVLDVPESNGQT